MKTLGTGKALTSFSKLIRNISRVLNWVAAACLLVLVVTITADVVMRYVFHHSLLWAWDLGNLIMVPIVFLSIAWVEAEGQHVYIGLVVDRLKSRLRLWFLLVATGLTLPFLVFFIWGVWLKAWSDWQIGQVTLGFYQIQVFPFSVTMTIGSLALFFQLIAKIIRLRQELIGRGKV
jgi:TRAP-type C4-dicarboxylate transport system permease small subunit